MKKLVRFFKCTELRSRVVTIITMLIFSCVYTSFSSDIYLFKTIHTGDYSISLPKGWDAEPSVTDSPKDSPNIKIISNGKQIGGIDVLSYDPSEPIELLFGNHVSRRINIDKIETSKVPAIKAIFERDWQSNEKRFVQYELHIYFIPGKALPKYGKDIVYDLYLNSGEIDIQRNPEMKELNEEMALKKILDVAGIDERKLIGIVEGFTLKD